MKVEDNSVHTHAHRHMHTRTHTRAHTHTHHDEQEDRQLLSAIKSRHGAREQQTLFIHDASSHTSTSLAVQLLATGQRQPTQNEARVLALQYRLSVKHAIAESMRRVQRELDCIGCEK